MNYEQAYKTLSKFVNENEFEGAQESRELFKSMDSELIKSDVMTAEESCYWRNSTMENFKNSINESKKKSSEFQTEKIKLTNKFNNERIVN